MILPPAEIEDNDVTIKLANRDTITPLGIVRDVEVLCGKMLNHTENIGYEIPSGMIEKLLDNPYAGDGTLHPHMHLISVDEVCGYLSLQVYPEMKLRRRFSLYFGGGGIDMV